MRTMLLAALLAAALIVGGGRFPAFAGCAGCDGRQRVDPLCGPKCLLSICEKLGVKADVTELAGLSNKDSRGTTLLGLSKAAEEKGLKAVGMKIGVDELAALEVPAIALLWGSHFVVAEGGAQGLLITDPSAPAVDAATGAGTVPLDTFRSRYSGFALLVGKPSQTFPEAASAGPDIRFDDYSYDLGFVDQGGQVAKSASLRNVGNATLGIWKVESSCDCITTRLADNIIAPGGQAQLEMTFDSEGQRGTQVRQIYVHSNDPISPLVVLEVGVTVKPDRVLVSDRSVGLGEVRRGAGADYALSVADPGDKSLVVSRVSSDSPYLAADLTRSTDGRPGYRVALELKPGVPIGEFRANVVLYTNHPKEPKVEIPVTATVKGNVEVYPSIFFLGYVKKGQAASRAIVIRTVGETPLTIDRVESPLDFLSVDVAPKQTGKEYVVSATLKDTAPLGSVKGDVIIHTNDADQPEIRAPVYALVEPVDTPAPAAVD